MKYKYLISFKYYKGSNGDTGRRLFELDEKITTKDHIRTIENEIISTCPEPGVSAVLLGFSLLEEAEE